ncbi:hypothetical protein [Protofrankia symbiont of Coriaria ruscifolia]|uniref:pyridoxamine 5'-phosphate oxidase family protein n=1 Tax=Protofrankia symbiont of Coriaria ruscifolia TaxID=1306542 RepID=UPI0010410AB4|nr:hypothetical protein [Protofrankia symbiont of Coriaria ruscifolia]
MTPPRQKFVNLEHEPRVALSIADPDDHYRFLEIRGAVDSIDGDPDTTFYRSLQRRYGNEYAITEAGVRVVIAIRPERFITVRGGEARRDI